MTDINQQREEAGQRLWLSRARAIQSYANVEHGLCALLAAFAQTDIHSATVIMFKIGAHPRNAILDDLMDYRYRDEYGTFWRSLMKRVRRLDGVRNNIVHWHEYIGLTATTATVGLSRPATWYSSSGISTMSVSAIDEFSAECGFVGRLLNVFHSHLLGKLKVDDPDDKPWHGVFKEPIAYPPPEAHPLYPFWQEEHCEPRGTDDQRTGA